MKIVKSHAVSDTKMRFITYHSGRVVRTFDATAAVAKRYARRFGLSVASPIDFWRDVTCD